MGVRPLPVGVWPLPVEVPGGIREHSQAIGKVSPLAARNSQFPSLKADYSWN
jgi:hypothetical protein